MNSNRIIIAIDGFSSTGKSTIAKQLAKTLNYIYVDTGAMYRAVTLYAIRYGYINSESFKSNHLIKDLPNIKLSFHFSKDSGFAEMYLNGKNIEREIRTMDVSKLVSKVSVISEVRKKLVSEQQAMGNEKGIVMDGRDIGTVVFPEAELKLFMTASAEKRTKRRYKELIDRGDKVSYKDILFNIQERDRMDSIRKHSPLKKAEDAIGFDNSDMSLEEQFERIMRLVNDRLST